VFALAGDRVVGFASGTVLRHPDKQPALFVNEVGVAEDVRQQGIGTTLCMALFATAREIGCQGIWLATESDNAAARALYRRLNARETGGIVVYDWDGAMDA
jgi:ribosomal protein S18 acetylase RimI-like enzyme